METLILRHTLPTDIDMIVDWERDPDNAPFIGPWERQGHLGAIHDPDIEHLVVEVGGIPVGFVILAGIAGTHDSLEFRRVVISSKGKGYGRATVEAVTELAFESRCAHRLWLDVKDDMFEPAISTSPSGSRSKLDSASATRWEIFTSR